MMIGQSSRRAGSLESLESRLCLTFILGVIPDGTGASATFLGSNGEDELSDVRGEIVMVGGVATEFIDWYDDGGTHQQALPAGISLSSIKRITVLGGSDNDEIHMDDLDGTLFDLRELYVDGGEHDDEIWLAPNAQFKGVAANRESKAAGDLGFDKIVGNDMDDKIWGGTYNGVNDSAVNWIEGGEGNDTLWGGSADLLADLMWGGPGGDFIFGQEGVDGIIGNAGNDVLSGGTGADVIWGGDGDDTIKGGTGTDWLDGGPDEDEMFSNETVAGADQNIIGSGGPDCDIEDGVVECEPRAAADSYDVHKNVAKVIAPNGVLANDDPMGDCDDEGCADEFTIVVTQNPSHGSVSLHLDANSHTDGGFTYTPTSNYVGTDTFEYVITNEVGTSEEATVTLTITNDPPVAVTDNLPPSGYSLEIGSTGSPGYGGGTPVSFPAAWLLANDTDANNDTLSASLYPSGGYNTANGHIQQNGDGSFTYTPNNGAVTSDSFQYRAFDGTDYSAPATVQLSLTNPAPIAVDDGTYTATARGTGGYGGSLSISSPGVLGNDTRTTGEWLSASVSSQPSHGSVTMNADGSFTYTPTALYTGADSFNYQVSDGYTTDIGTANLNVVNQAPVAQNDSYSMMAYGGYGGTLNVSSPGVLNNDSDADSHPRTATLTQSPASGSLTFNSNGSFTYNSAAGVTGPVTFKYKAYDGMSYSNEATVTITIMNPLVFTGNEEAEEPTNEVVTLEEAQNVLLAAGQSWINAGLTQEAIDDVLASVSIVITDLPGAQLAGVADGVIYLDANAAGYGWYAGITYDDPAAAGRVDLMTAFRHEIGHLLGLEHTGEEEQGGLMDDELGLGTRREVSAADAAIAQWLWEQEE